MSEASAFVLPSCDEPFGIVILEAATIKVAVFAASSGGIPEIIDDERLGLLLTSKTMSNLQMLSDCFFEISRRY